MNTQKIIPLIKGSIKHLPGVKKVLYMTYPKGKTSSSVYCYSAWMRHLRNWNKINEGVPSIIAEIGPGATLGTSLAALLSGCKTVHALEAIKYWDTEMNLAIFDELVELFKNKTPVPEKTNGITIPRINNLNFPSEIISDAQLEDALAPARLNKIRKEIADIDNPNNTMIKVYIPWYDDAIIEKNSIDFIFSQGILQSVDDLPNCYQAINKWIKPSGVMSHAMDFSSLGHTQLWNDHWTYNKLEWKIVKGGSSFLINRYPRSSHLDFHKKMNFKVIHTEYTEKENTLNKHQLSTDFQHLETADLTTWLMYVLSIKES